MQPSSPARITSSRASASATRACAAHARRARVCITFEGNIVLGTVASSLAQATGGGTATKRTVLKRFERVELLRKRGEFKEGGRITGLKKTKPEE